MSKTISFILINFFLLSLALSTRSISFESADINVNIRTATGEWVASAFNATTAVSDPQLMQWVSLGVPRLIAKVDSANSTEGSERSAFNFVPGGFYILVETLSAEVASELAQRASFKYNSQINASQFIPLNKHLDAFNCYMKLFDVKQNAFVMLAGSAVDLSNPATIFFETNASKYEKVLLEKELSLLIQCNVDSIRKQCTQQSAQTCSRTEPAFTERFSLSPRALRVDVQLESSLQSAKQAFIRSVLAAVDKRLRAVDQRLSSFNSTYASRFACTFGLIDSTVSSLLEANISACAAFTKQNIHKGSAVYTSNGTFVVPLGVSSVRVLLVGGGAGGGSGHAGGGGSGYVQVGEVAVEQFERVSIVVGRGGQGSSYRYSDSTQNSTAGERSAFGLYLTANGGVAPTTNWQGSAGGSGGGAPSHPSYSTKSGTGGTDGSSGSSSQWQNGGSGQGTYSNKLTIFKLNSFAPGNGGAGDAIANGYVGGGGGGGVLMNGTGPSGGNGHYARGGTGYGAGGGGGYNLGGHWFAGAKGADGLVYIEW